MFKWIYVLSFFIRFSGSDAASIQTRATLSDDGKHFHLNGSKVFVELSENFLINQLNFVSDQYLGQVAVSAMYFPTMQ